MMNNGWKPTSLSDLLEPVSRPVSVEPDVEYTLLGARWYAKGLYQKERKLGSDIKANRLYRVQQNDFVYNRLFAWKGSFAVATDDNDGCFVSNEFPCFTAQPDRLDPRFLWYYFSREASWNKALGLSHGATPTSRNRLKEEHFLRLQVPLPPLEEQQRIVARIDRLAAMIDEADHLNKQLILQSALIAVAMAHRTDLDITEKVANGWRDIRLGDIIVANFDDQTVVATEQYPNLGIYSYGRGLFPKPPIEGMETSATRLRRVHSGQFIYSRLFAWEGAFGLVTPEYDGWFVSNEYPTFDCDESQILPEFLYAYFKAKQAWIAVAAGSKGLGSRRQRVQPDQILDHRIMLPPMHVQHTIRRVLSRTDEAHGERLPLSMKLDAMLPSILDRAFKGEL